MSDLTDIPVPPDNGNSRLVTLHRMIERLGAVGSAKAFGERQVSVDSQAQLAGIFDEIDEAVMPRRLVFRNGGSGTLGLEVRNRRLFWAEFETGLATTAGLGVGPLSYAGADDLAALGAALQGFCDGGALSVIARPARRKPELDETGVSAATLRHILQQFQPATTGPTVCDTALGEFTANCSPLIRAWVLATTCGVSSHGEEALSSGLAQALAAFEGALAAMACADPLAVILAPADETLGRVAFLSAGMDRAALAIRTEDQDSLLTRWSDWLAN